MPRNLHEIQRRSRPALLNMVAHVLKQRFVFFVLDDHALKEGARIYKRGAPFLDLKLANSAAFGPADCKSSTALKSFKYSPLFRHIYSFSRNSSAAFSFTSRPN